ncbi:hypothetical protein CEE55_22420 [Stenotrophomonas pavanii]|uniref:Uncharacterized protein n=1 Tax=Stenotrophomonas pavanii TaxID=487698 RepID=A0A246KQP7_9GAMM|nr:DUF1737 domain-containing protein [Stenotrophomonas pavanii]OWR25639.1 hypothetical protein CEE55_22420 [Stenotrophomonas pavanii]
MNLEQIDTSTTAGKEEAGEYRVATGDTKKDLHEEVALLLRLGYLPHGGVAIMTRKYYRKGYQVDGEFYAQAMWKRADLAGEKG